MNNPQPKIQARYRERLREAGKEQYNRIVTHKEREALDKLLAKLRRKK